MDNFIPQTMPLYIVELGDTKTPIQLVVGWMPTSYETWTPMTVDLGQLTTIWAKPVLKNQPITEDSILFFTELYRAQAQHESWWDSVKETTP